MLLHRREQLILSVFDAEFSLSLGSVSVIVSLPVGIKHHS